MYCEGKVERIFAGYDFKQVFTGENHADLYL